MPIGASSNAVRKRASASALPRSASARAWTSRIVAWTSVSAPPSRTAISWASAQRQLPSVRRRRMVIATRSSCSASRCIAVTSVDESPGWTRSPARRAGDLARRGRRSSSWQPSEISRIVAVRIDRGEHVTGVLRKLAGAGVGGAAGRLGAVQRGGRVGHAALTPDALGAHGGQADAADQHPHRRQHRRLGARDQYCTGECSQSPERAGGTAVARSHPSYVGQMAVALKFRAVLPPPVRARRCRGSLRSRVRGRRDGSAAAGCRSASRSGRRPAEPCAPTDSAAGWRRAGA